MSHMGSGGSLMAAWPRDHCRYGGRDAPIGETQSLSLSIYNVACAKQRFDPPLKWPKMPAPHRHQRNTPFPEGPKMPYLVSFWVNGQTEDMGLVD
jgi:hypothetical protein